MNTVNDLNTRLLNLFSVKSLKDAFDVDGALLKSEMLEDVTARFNSQTIRTTCIENINFCKQHIYIYDLLSPFNRALFDIRQFPLENATHFFDGANLKIKCLPTIEYRAILKDPYQTVNLRFLQPITITVTRNKVIVQTVIIEKNISSYVGGRKVLDVQKSNNTDFTDLILQFFSRNYAIRPSNINRGIKRMWADDKIDSRYVKFKKNRSTATETMDEEYTVKSQYPDVYNQLINAPLNKTLFKYLLHDEEMISHFTADPSNGELSITIFSDNENQIRNVIDEILRNN